MAHSSDSRDFPAGTAENGEGANPRRAAGRFAARADDFADSWGRRYVFQICAMLGVGILGWMAWEVASIDVLRRDVAAMQRNIVEIETDIEDMRETIHAMDKRLTNVERDIGRINENIANIMAILQKQD